MPGMLNDHIDQADDVATLCSGFAREFPSGEDQNTQVTLQDPNGKWGQSRNL